ncbi:hypothetical protein [Flavobacterium psychrophilum]|uniref:hypothetical protein n=1 Tax=Flavobacterium psychrophilum TaxID=96345 RepID=UPI000B7C373D|nr:hypothetical protein [Flavobacterium psychrophilum]MCB6232066.1 hypothetical protein [Flavobacterium psychrophilum]SNA80262.1 hypothetical protein FI146_340001 [Flavobacterium psychrophilum]SNB08641.1 hypothetical protein JIP1600_1660001 [Flavobacterium psychrophilum]
MKMILIKTPYKGLFITENGKAWRNDLKIEIKPTANGKVRFNGKLYDLQKLINYSRQNNTKAKRINTKQPPPVKKSVPVRELQKIGFKKTQISGLYVSKNGKAYNYNSNRYLTATTKGIIVINRKGYNFAKLILETFCKIENRSGQINFINGNDKDFRFENLEYKSTIKQPPPVPTDLIKCIRFYFEVDKTFKTSNILYKFYLYEIIKMRNFNYKYKGLDFDLFLDYSKNDFCVLSNNQKTVFDKFNYTATNGKNAINKYLNLLVNECLQDYENGLLKLKEYKPKPPTKTDTLRALQKTANEYGLNVKIPLRKKSIKELLHDYKKHTKAIETKIENLKREPPK